MNDAAPGETAAKKLESIGVRRLVAIACGLTLVAIALMVWSVLDPTPLPVMVVMSIGQLFGTGGLLCYLVAVLVHRTQRAGPRAEEMPAKKQQTPPAK